jgi:glutamate/tyrosine decarboxylase-like PLP-dependent enzyme
MPASAHAAFAKAASYLRVALDVVPVDPKTLRPAAADMAAAMTPETVLVVCSAPSYAHGVIDPVGEVAASAAEAGVRCHVDACFGGWALPWLRRAGVAVPPFDFSVPGVTSISVDLHKYAYAPKGASVLLHRDASLRAPQYFAWADWPGYTMVNPTVASTRSGGPIAAAFATLRFIGEDGYLRLAGLTVEAVRGLAAAVSTVDGLRLMAEPESTVVAFTSDDAGLDLFVLADELTARGWHTQPQFAYRQSDGTSLPRSVHLTVTASVAPLVAEFQADLTAAVAAARAIGPANLPDELVAFAGSLSPEMLTEETVAGLADALGLGGGDGGGPLPARMAVVNTLLEAAPPRIREALLTAFFGLLQRP